MSGGSWDYICYKLDDAANHLLKDKSALRRAFGEHMRLVAKAMHDIEWVDSCDYGEGDDIESINNVLGDKTKELQLNILLKDATNIIEEINKLKDEQSE